MHRVVRGVARPVIDRWYRTPLWNIVITPINFAALVAEGVRCVRLTASIISETLQDETSSPPPQSFLQPSPSDVLADPREEAIESRHFSHIP